MNDHSDKIRQLSEKINELLSRQEIFSKEINALKSEIDRLKYSQADSTVQVENQPKPEKVQLPFIVEEEKPMTSTPPPPVFIDRVVQPSAQREKPNPTPSRNLEKFIGENLINKIGIVITVIGVSIGAKYAIDHDLISPLTRIILGYLMGIGLMLFAIKLKKDYEKFSAVLLSGSMAILYFITFAGFSYYQLMIREVAFGLMFLFTVFTVFAAIQYNQQVIALIGLVGAYAVPFLLSNNSGQVSILYSYMAIINAGIAVLAFRKRWKPVFYSSFGLTWLIYLAWFATKYTFANDFAVAGIFGFLFFAIFYSTFLVDKLIRVEKLNSTDVILLLLNSFIFYSVGYDMLSSKSGYGELLGVFTLCNGVIHFIVCVLIQRRQLGDKSPLYLVAALVLTFITIAIPVQLDGNWVTLLWTAEAAVLFGVGRNKSIAIYEKIGVVLMFLAFFSMAQDWGIHIQFEDGSNKPEISFLNITFLSSILLSIAFGFVAKMQAKQIDQLSESKGLSLNRFFLLAPIVLFVIAAFLTFRIEIDFFFQQKYFGSKVNLPDNWTYDDDYNGFRQIWLINYSLLFTGVVYQFISRKSNNQLALEILSVATIYFLLEFFAEGFSSLAELRHSYLVKPNGTFYFYSISNILIRYISIPFILLALYCLSSYTQLATTNFRFKKMFDVFFHFSILILLSTELINWIDILGEDEPYNLGLTILWGVYALFLIGIGIKNKKKHIRLAAIALFSITLLKLFFDDMSDMSTISKTIAFVLLGILLLIISFLYNKYKHYLADE